MWAGAVEVELVVGELAVVLVGSAEGVVFVVSGRLEPDYSSNQIHKAGVHSPWSPKHSQRQNLDSH